MTVTIQNTNFVQFMHQVVKAVESGYTLDYEPSNAPESVPFYKIVLTPRNTSKELVEASNDAVEDDTPPSQTEKSTTQENKPQVGRPARGSRK